MFLRVFFPCFKLKTCRDDMSSDGPPRDDMSSDGPPRDDMSSTTRKSRILDGGAKKVLLCPGRISFPISRTLSLISGHCPDIGTRKRMNKCTNFAAPHHCWCIAREYWRDSHSHGFWMVPGCASYMSHIWDGPNHGTGQLLNMKTGEKCKIESVFRFS